MTASLGRNGELHLGGGLPCGAEDVGPLLLRWWQCGLLPGEDAPVECLPVSSPNGQLSLRLCVLLERLTDHLASAMPHYAGQSADNRNSEVESISTVRLASYVDTWLESNRIASDLDGFERALVDSDRFFELKWPSGKRIVATLSQLCAVRMAKFLMREPNPVFFSPAELPNSKDPSGDCLFFDPRWLLPTSTAREARDRLLSGDQRINVEPCQLYLASAFLPELLGQMVLIPTTEDDGGATPSRGLRSANTDQFTLGKRVARFSLPVSLTRIGFLRFGFLALARVVKRIFEPSAQYGSWQLRLIQRLTGPWSSERWFGRNDFRQLKRLVKWAGG